MLHKDRHTNRWLIGRTTETRDEANGRLSLFIRTRLKVDSYQRPGFNMFLCVKEFLKD